MMRRYLNRLYFSEVGGATEADKIKSLTTAEVIANCSCEEQTGEIEPHPCPTVINALVLCTCCDYCIGRCKEEL